VISIYFTSICGDKKHVTGISDAIYICSVLL